MADFDVIVLGTGGAGLTAAVTAADLGARVGLFEKGDTVAGTTAYSGGMIWIPLNQHEPPEKGDSREKALAYLQARGDPTLRDGTPRASLGALETEPSYAIEVFSGALGTKGGPLTDTAARVLDVDGDVIPGLYAAGNAMASPLGMTHGGAGGTLGPAMTFGYIAARDVARRVASTRDVPPAGAHPGA